MTKPLVISNLEVGDDTFDSTEGSWNVTRARRDCDAGKHRLYAFNVTDVFECNKNVDVDDAKVAAFVAAIRADPDAFPPLIFAMEKERVWLIEGHHRIRALHRLGVTSCTGYVIEDEDSKPYRVTFNGERVAPWSKR